MEQIRLVARDKPGKKLVGEAVGNIVGQLGRVDTEQLIVA